eukprot:CAMPEP_0170862720 /NCGR_PEP_ID=MMETSP0734-20130129/19189_1 /TAXON_ID=186038 /ORGANISM="Fragilariopsis kerguelensis, Strain L26-C5" /LENGTH=413 /DNA_ID=CAMNT_0011237469 /DNA_START=34 /DNA_END=1275 /DNA_ORIENTATION=-
MMLSSLSSAFGLLLVCLCALLLPTTIQGQLMDLLITGVGGGVMDLIIPEEVFAVIPESCQGDNNSAELTAVINCAVTNFMQCAGLLGVLDQFETIIPTDASKVNTCNDIESSFCPIASQCSVCEDQFDALARCIITFTPVGVIDQSIIDLVDSCALVCNAHSVKAIGFGDSGIIADTIGTQEVTDNDIIMLDEKDIATTAKENGSLTTFFAALVITADLVPTLSEPNGPVSVFAPIDDAFAALPEKLIPCLFLSENQDTLTSILTYHVIREKVVLSALSSGHQIHTIQGETIGITFMKSTESNATIVYANNVNVITPDVLTTNGAIHVIGSVLVPPSIDIAAFLTTCPEVAEPVVPVDSSDAVDQPGDLFGGIDADDSGEPIGDVVVGNVIGTIVESFVGLISVDVNGWGFGW